MSHCVMYGSRLDGLAWHLTVFSGYLIAMLKYRFSYCAKCSMTCICLSRQKKFEDFSAKLCDLSSLYNIPGDKYSILTAIY